MPPVSDLARAKINLTLRVHGRRTDGFHELTSLVVFADVADRVEMTPADTSGFSLSGPFVAALGRGQNLVEQAAMQFRERFPDTPPVHITLDKQLPVAAGLGGGSADAAAILRLLAHLQGGTVTDDRLDRIAMALGSDIAVCLRSSAAWMTGRGEKVVPIPDFPKLPTILVNPGAALGASEVYAALKAPVLEETEAELPHRFSVSGDTFDLIDALKHSSNDLQAPAIRLAPVINDVVDAIAATKGCQLARMSGSGSTCFGLYASEREAKEASEKIAARFPQWWITHTVLS